MVASTIFFLLQGLLPAGVIPCNQGSSNHPYQSNIKAAHPAIHWPPKQFSHCPHQFFRIPLYAIPYPQNQATRFIDCTIETRVISPSAVQMQVKARDSQRDHWDLPDKCQTTEEAEAICLGRSCGQTCVNEERRGGPLLVSAPAASPKQAPIQRLIRQPSISEILHIVHQSQGPLCLMVLYIDAVGLIFLSLHPD